MIESTIEMNNQIFNGKTFNEKYLDQILVKLTNQLENHNGYQFQTGLNIDSITFKPKGECQPGGIYFCQLKHLPLWVNYSNKQMFYVRFVTIPDDALVWIERDKFKADRLILVERLEIGDLEVWKDPAYCLTAVKNNNYAFKYVKEQTEEINLAAVKKDGRVLKYVLEQTEKINLAAVKTNGYALEYVLEQTPQICLAAVKNSGCALQYVRE